MVPERPHKEYIDSVYSPLKETTLCYIFCDDGDSLEMYIPEGYIVTGADFNKDHQINLEGVLPYKPDPGEKSVLFLHFQPVRTAKMIKCPSSNLVVFLELEELTRHRAKDISENIQLALFTGGPFYRYTTKSAVRGQIEVVHIENGVAHIILFLDFEIDEENITGIKLETRLSIIQQQDIL